MDSQIPNWKDVQVESTNTFDEWTTLQDLTYALSTGQTVTIKAGFETDLASIPRALWNIYPPFSPQYRVAAILHDGLYASELLPRSQCDWELLSAMQAGGCSWFTRNVFWLAVRAGGAFVWKQHTPQSITDARKFVSLA